MNTKPKRKKKMEHKQQTKDKFVFVEFTKPWIHSHQIGSARNREEADYIQVYAGREIYGKAVTDNYACDLRVKATGEVLHAANWSEKRGDPPRIPATALFVARACEERLRQEATARR